MAVTFKRSQRRQIANKRRQQKRRLLMLLLLNQHLLLCCSTSLILQQSPPLPPEYAFSATQGLARSLIPLIVKLDPKRIIKKRKCHAKQWLEHEPHLLTMTGFSCFEFEKLWARVHDVVEQCGLRTGAELKKPLQRGAKLKPKVLLLLVLTFLRRYPPSAVLGAQFGISKSSVNEWLQVLIPQLAERLKPEVQFPSEERLKHLVGAIPAFPKACGHIDMTIHRMRRPEVEEWRLFRGDKYCHFMNTLTMVDFTGSFLWVEPGFGGRLLDRQAFEESDLYKKLTECQGKVLADNGFKGQEHVITPPNKTIGERMHKAERAQQESTYQELHAQFAATAQLWRHKKSFHAPTILLCCELFNFKKRLRMLEGLNWWDKEMGSQ